MDYFERLARWLNRVFESLSSTQRTALLVFIALLILIFAFSGIRGCIPDEPIGLPSPHDSTRSGATLSGEDIDSSQNCRSSSVNLCVTRKDRNNCTGPEAEQSSNVFLYLAEAEIAGENVIVRSYCEGYILQQAACDDATGRIRFIEKLPTDLSCPGLKVACREGINQYFRDGDPLTINIENGPCL